MSKKIIILFTIVCMLFVSVQGVQAAGSNDDEVDQEQTGTNNRFGYSNGGIFAQSFIPSLDILTRVKIYCQPKDNCHDYGFIKVSIRSDLEGYDLTSTTVSAGDMPETYYWVEFDFSDISVNTGKMYYIVVEVDDNSYSTGYFFKTGPAWNPYEFGKMHWKYSSGWQPGNEDDDLSFQTYGKIGNPAPYTPSNPSPMKGASEVSISTKLSWSGGDPEGDDVFYDVYFEADNPNPNVLVSNDQQTTIYNPGSLELDTTYYWKVIATDEHQMTAESPIWSFTTEDEPTIEEITINFKKLNFRGSVGAVINNEGTATILNLDCKMNVSGGLLKRVNASANVSIENFVAADSISMSTGPRATGFGLGMVKVSAEVIADGVTYTKEANGLIIGRITVIF